MTSTSLYRVGMTSTSGFDSLAPAGLAPVAEVVTLIRELQAEGATREGIDADLSAKFPGLDALTGVSGAASWLGLTEKTIYQERSRKRADGTPRFPEADATVGRSPMWTWRTLAWHTAGMPQGPRWDDA